MKLREVSMSSDLIIFFCCIGLLLLLIFVLATD